MNVPGHFNATQELGCSIFLEGIIIKKQKDFGTKSFIVNQGQLDGNEFEIMLEKNNKITETCVFLFPKPYHDREKHPNEREKYRTGDDSSGFLRKIHRLSLLGIQIKLKRLVRSKTKTTSLSLSETTRKLISSESFCVFLFGYYRAHTKS